MPRPKKSPAQPSKQRMSMPVAAEEMKPFAAFLERELTTWPQVTAKSMFGMLALYRGKQIFAALPRTRALGAANAIMCKLPKDDLTGPPGKGWKTIEIVSSADLRAALEWLERAYQQARSSKKR